MKRFCLIAVLFCFLQGCSHAGNDDFTAGDLRAMDHVAGRDINWFSVNGYSAPGLGGGYCCIMLPMKWFPGMQAKIEWETAPKITGKVPGYENLEEYMNWERELKKKNRKFRETVNVPEYGKSRCGMSVHFLPCNQVKVTTTCVGYGTPNYPIKEPMNMPEPKVCPK